jgi:hypothetical protein
MVNVLRVIYLAMGDADIKRRQYNATENVKKILFIPVMENVYQLIFLVKENVILKNTK